MYLVDVLGRWCIVDKFERSEVMCVFFVRSVVVFRIFLKVI